MKRIVILFITLCISAGLSAQFPNYPISILDAEEEIIGNSYHDLQSNGSCQNRIYFYSDGIIGATWTYGLDFPLFSDRGTGYNYYLNNSGPWPSERIESDRTGWPSYAPLGEFGEIVFSHFSGTEIDGLSYCHRPYRIVGEWEEHIFQGPTGNEGLVWPRMVTGGENNNTIFLIAITMPVANGGTTYQGMDGALLYSRSIDAGETWIQENVLFPELDSSNYRSITGDCYAFAEPRNNVVAFIAGSCNHDLFLMKSTDYGETFNKNIIWDHPFDNGYQVIPQDTFYCTDGSIAVAIDPQGKVHVVSGITKTWHIENYEFHGLYWNVDGLLYWNEDMPTFSSNKNALNPYSHPESELILNESLIGWSQDVNGDSVVTLLEEYGRYRGHGMSTMPQIVIDNANRIFIVYTSVTETFDNGAMNYRRLWMRSSLDGGNTWGQFYHYAANDPTHIFSEFSYPSCAANSEEHIYLIYQMDNEPGLSMYGGGDNKYYEENFYYFAKIPKDEIVGINQNNQSTIGFEVSQNYPNPFSGSTTIKVNLQQPMDIKLEVFNMLGERVYELPASRGNVGLNSFRIQAEHLSPGIYFYTISTGLDKITNKMIIK